MNIKKTKTVNFIRWRIGRDSNPRRTCALAGFQDQSYRPLSHLSTNHYNNIFFKCLVKFMFCLTYHLLGKNPLFFYYIFIIFIWRFKILRQTSDISCQTLMQASSFPTFSPRFQVNYVVYNDYICI